MRWMQSRPGLTEFDSIQSIELKKCPICETSIRRTKSLNTFIQVSLRDIEQVKLKTWGDPKENKMSQSNLKRKTGKILDGKSFKVKMVQLRAIYANIFHETFNRKYITKAKLIELTNKFELAETLRTICVEFEKRHKSQQNVRTKFTEIFKGRIRMAAAFIKDFGNCEQQRNDIATEISFLQMMGDVIVDTCGQPFNDAGKKLLNEAFELANKYGSATESVRKEFSRLVNEAGGHSGLTIASEDKQMVLRYMGFQCGYWFKCANGHIYCMGECDDAMGRSMCPECEWVDGVENHSLVRTSY